MKIGDTIYLDHQSTTPLDSIVFTAMVPYFSDLFGNPHSVDHCVGWRSARAVDDAASRVAGLIGAYPDEIIFTSGATEANNLALLGLGRRASGGNRKRILISAIEHKCVFASCYALQSQLGYVIDLVPVDSMGFVDVSVLNDMISNDVLAVSIMAVNNEIGTIQNIEYLSGIIRNCGAIFHCDAAQAPSALRLDHMSQHVDLLSLSGHKMYGPQGVGALFIQRGLQHKIEPIIYGGGQQRNLRSGTVPVALCVGMGCASEMMNNHGSEDERTVVRKLRDVFVSQLTDLPWPVFLNGPDSLHRHPGNANVRFEGIDAHNLINTIQPHLAASMGSACTSGISEPSHVLRAIGLSGEEAEASIRFSLGRGTTEADLEEAVQIINRGLTKLVN